MQNTENTQSTRDPSQDRIVRPMPSSTSWTEPFWAALNEHEFRLWHCHTCDAWYWPPAYCRFHPNERWAQNMSWDLASGLGRVFAFNITQIQYHPLFPPPYVYALVELEEGPLFGTNIVGCDPEAVYSGMPVQISYQDCVSADGQPFTLAMFHPRS